MRPNLLVFLFATSCIFLSVSLAYADDSFLKRHEDKEQSNDSFHKCVERIKEYMQEKPSFAIDIESNMPALEAFFKRVEKGRSQKSYSINKSNEFVTEIKYQESLDSDHNKFEMMYKLEDLVDKDLPPEHNYAHKLSLKVEMNAISSGNIVHSLTQKYLINNVDVCGPLLAEVEYVDYLFNANEGSKTYRVQGSGAKLHKRNKSFEKINFVHQSAFASCPSDFEGISKDFVQPNEVKECFLAEGFFDNIRYSLSEPRIISGFDPILKKQVDFKVNAIKMFFYDEQVNLRVESFDYPANLRTLS